MADTKDGRERQARDRDRRQRTRELLEELERDAETEPPVPEEDLEDVEAALESVSYPATGAEVVATAGAETVEASDGTLALGDLLPETDRESFGSARAVRLRIQRPSIAAAMKRVVEAVDTIPNAELEASRRNGYEKTLRALKDIEEDDEDEGIEVVTDWIVARIRDEDEIPSSRAVRQRAAEFCRNNGYPVGDNDWLGA